MKKFLLHLFMILIALTGACYLFLYWTGLYTPAPLVACLYSDTAPLHLELDTMQTMLEREGYRFARAAITDNLADNLTAQATAYIEDDVQVLLLDLTAIAPDDALFDLAEAHDVTLLFVGDAPDTRALDAYDKAWYLGADAAYAGELLGTEIAAGFRDGGIIDANEDRLLDYFLSDTQDANTSRYLQPALLECAHYGVYTTNILDTAALEATAEESAESEDTQRDADEATSAEGSEAPTDDALSAYETTFLPMPEVILSLGEVDAQLAHAFAKKQGWMQAEHTPTFTAIVESYAIAKALCATSDYHAIVYYDTVYTTDALIQMTINAVNHRYITLNTNFAPESDSTFRIPYQLYQ